MTSGAYDIAPKGGEDAFVSKLNGPGVPQVVSVSPASSTGLSQSFQFVYSDSAGYASLSWVQALINSPFSPYNACRIHYVPAANYMWLMNDSSTQWLGPATLGSAGTLPMHD